MAAKKDSPIKLKQDADAAEKAGRFDKSIELLKQIVQDNPRDWNTVNRIGDLYAKLNKLKEANEQYQKVARYFADDGFYLKSIAVWKKVLRNDPSLSRAIWRSPTSTPARGSQAEAKQTFGAVFDEYVKRNRMREAGDVLRRLAEVDPSDMKVRIKLAELYARDGHQEKAAGEYIAIADELLKKGHLAEALQLIDKSLRSGPRSPRLLSAAAHVHIVQKDYAKAIELLEEARRATPADREISLRLAEAFLGYRRPDDARRVLEALLQRDPSDQDARQQLGRCTSPRDATTRRSTRCCRWSTSWWSGARWTVPPLCCSRSSSVTRSTSRAWPSWSSSTASRKNDMLVAQTYGQMVEAYMATGGLEQAASILDMLVQLEPHNEQHRTKLKWLREQKGVAPGTNFEVDLSQQAQRRSGPPLAFAAPAKPARPAGIELSGPLSADDQEFISEHLAEGRVFRKYGLGDKARDQFESVLGRFPDNLEALQELVEIFKEKGDSAAAGQKLRVMAEVHRLKGEADKAARADADADALVGPVAAPAAPAPPLAAPVPVPVPVPPPRQRTAPPLAVAPPADVEMDIAVEEPAAPVHQDEDLEYVEMGEEAAPLPPPEFDASDLAPAGEIGGQFLDEEPPPADAGFDLDEAPQAPAPFVTTGLVAQPAPAPAAAASGVPADLRRAIDEIESYVSMGFVDDARGVLAEVATRLSAYPALVQRLAELGLEVEAVSDMDSLLGEAEAVPAPEATAEEPLQLGEGFLEFTPSTTLPTAPEPQPVAAGGDGDAFDLASELGGLFGAQPAVAEEPTSAPASTDLGDASLADIFREFQKGVDKQLGKEDYETRYNLGIAYKEMGLVDEAIAEFQLAAKDEGAPARVREHARDLLHREGHAQAGRQVVRERPSGPGPQRRGVPGAALRPRERPRAGG